MQPVSVYYKKASKLHRIQKYLFHLLIILFICASVSYCIRLFLFFPAILPNNSMVPGLPNNSLIFWLYSHLSEIDRNDVVYIRHGKNREELVCRILGLPGETILIKEQDLYINGTIWKNDQKIKIKKNRQSFPLKASRRDNISPIKLTEDSYFCLTDNRSFMIDSRFKEPFKRENILAKAIFRNILGKKI